MVGSDRPVLRLAGDYARVWKESLSVLAPPGGEARASVLGGSAERVDGPPWAPGHGPPVGG